MLLCSLFASGYSHFVNQVYQQGQNKKVGLQSLRNDIFFFILLSGGQSAIHHQRNKCANEPFFGVVVTTQGEASLVAMTPLARTD